MLDIEMSAGGGCYGHCRLRSRFALLHRLTDDAFGQAFRAGVLYRQGFGDRALLERLVASVGAYVRTQPLGEVRMTWSGRTRSVLGADVRVGSFVSPAPTPLPTESRTAPVELWLPRHGARGAMCLVLAASGEEGFLRRRVFVRRLLEAGIGALLLENPFYGLRRPAGQHGPALRTVADQFAMNTATVDEARALLGWIRDEGYFPGVTGFSQGGFMAAFAAALVDFPVVAVPRGVGTSAVPVFTNSALSHGVRWKTLAAESGSEAQARADLARYLAVVDLTQHPPPVAPQLATILVARHDRFVPPEDGEALHRHWAGSHLEWSEAGHVTSLLMDGKDHARAIVEAFDRRW